MNDNKSLILEPDCRQFAIVCQLKRPPIMLWSQILEKK